MSNMKLYNHIIENAAAKKTPRKGYNFGDKTD